MTDAQQYVVPNAFPQIAEENGAEGLNASTGEDSTQFFWSMPSNRLQLWAPYMESGRLAEPVEREFYKERDVVQEERRMRIDSSPFGRMPGAVCRDGLRSTSVWALRGWVGK